jgi:hypothetical protein
MKYVFFLLLAAGDCGYQAFIWKAWKKISKKSCKSCQRIKIKIESIPIK